MQRREGLVKAEDAHHLLDEGPDRLGQSRLRPVDDHGRALDVSQVGPGRHALRNRQRHFNVGELEVVLEVLINAMTPGVGHGYEGAGAPLEGRCVPQRVVGVAC